MIEKKNTNKILTFILALIICISAVVLLYVNLPEDETADGNIIDDNINDNQTEESDIVLTVRFGDEQFNYTIDEIKSMSSYTGEGSKINKKYTITGPYNYTGVKISTFLSEFENLPLNYSINSMSSDGYTQHYTYQEMQGNVEKLNETRVSLGIGNFTMIIAYKQDGVEITDSEDGPLMIVFVDNYYSDSSLWARQLNLIEVIKE
jgi:hypothetical protein